MRSLFRSVYLSSMGAFKVPARGVHILNGHHLTRMSSSNRAPFFRMLKALRNRAEFMNIERAAELVLSGEVGSFDGCALAFTFDDGFLDCYSGIAPVLSDFDVNACFFVNSRFVEAPEPYVKNFVDKVVLTPGKLPMSRSQIIELSKNGFVIGNHTADHVRLNTQRSDVLWDQIVSGQNELVSFIGKDVNFFAWPYGQLSDVSEEALSLVLKSHKYVFSGADYRNYRSFEGRVINRRHFEPDWNVSHMNYFLSAEKSG